MAFFDCEGERYLVCARDKSYVRSGSVGAGKSTFIRRYYRHLMTPEVREKTIWAFIDFNVTGSQNDMNNITSSPSSSNPLKC